MLATIFLDEVEQTEQLADLEQQFTDVREMLSRGLAEHQFAGHDALCISLELLRTLNVEICIRTDNDLALLKELSADDIGTIVTDSALRKQLINTLKDINGLVLFAIEFNVAQLQALFRSCGRYIYARLLHRSYRQWRFFLEALPTDKRQAIVTEVSFSDTGEMLTDVDEESRSAADIMLTELASIKDYQLLFQLLSTLKQHHADFFQNAIQPRDEYNVILSKVAKELTDSDVYHFRKLTNLQYVELLIEFISEYNLSVAKTVIGKFWECFSCGQRDNSNAEFARTIAIAVKYLQRFADFNLGLHVYLLSRAVHGPLFTIARYHNAECIGELLLVYLKHYDSRNIEPDRELFAYSAGETLARRKGRGLNYIFDQGNEIAIWQGLQRLGLLEEYFFGIAEDRMPTIKLDPWGKLVETDVEPDDLLIRQLDILAELDFSKFCELVFDPRFVKAVIPNWPNEAPLAVINKVEELVQRTGHSFWNDVLSAGILEHALHIGNYRLAASIIEYIRNNFARLSPDAIKAALLGSGSAERLNPFLAILKAREERKLDRDRMRYVFQLVFNKQILFSTEEYYRLFSQAVAVKDKSARRSANESAVTTKTYTCLSLVQNGPQTSQSNYKDIIWCFHAKRPDIIGDDVDYLMQMGLYKHLFEKLEELEKKYPDYYQRLIASAEFERLVATLLAGAVRSFDFEDSPHRYDRYTRFEQLVTLVPDIAKRCFSAVLLTDKLKPYFTAEGTAMTCQQLLVIEYFVDQFKEYIPSVFFYNYLEKFGGYVSAMQALGREHHPYREFKQHAGHFSDADMAELLVCSENLEANIVIILQAFSDFVTTRSRVKFAMASHPEFSRFIGNIFQGLDTITPSRDFINKFSHILNYLLDVMRENQSDKDQQGNVEVAASIVANPAFFKLLRRFSCKEAVTDTAEQQRWEDTEWCVNAHVSPIYIKCLKTQPNLCNDIVQNFLSSEDEIEMEFITKLLQLTGYKKVNTTSFHHYEIIYFITLYVLLRQGIVGDKAMIKAINAHNLISKYMSLDFLPEKAVDLLWQYVASDDCEHYLDTVVDYLLSLFATQEDAALVRSNKARALQILQKIKSQNHDFLISIFLHERFLAEMTTDELNAIWQQVELSTVLASFLHNYAMQLLKHNYFNHLSRFYHYLRAQPGSIYSDVLKLNKPAMAVLPVNEHLQNALSNLAKVDNALWCSIVDIAMRCHRNGLLSSKLIQSQFNADFWDRCLNIIMQGELRGINIVSTVVNSRLINEVNLPRHFLSFYAMHFCVWLRNNAFDTQIANAMQQDLLLENIKLLLANITAEFLLGFNDTGQFVITLLGGFIDYLEMNMTSIMVSSGNIRVLKNGEHSTREANSEKLAAAKALKSGVENLQTMDIKVLRREYPGLKAAEFSVLLAVLERIAPKAKITAKLNKAARI